MFKQSSEVLDPGFELWMANGDCAGVCGHASPNSVASQTSVLCGRLRGARKRFAPAVDWAYGTPSHCFISPPLLSVTSSPVTSPSKVVTAVGSLGPEDESLQADSEKTEANKISIRKAVGIR